MTGRDSKGKFIKGHSLKLRKDFTGFWKGKKRPEISLLHTGEGNPMWGGAKISKTGIHTWLRKTYGRPNICEFCKDTNMIKYDWALKVGFSYERKRENFIRLCRGCHMKYDYKNGTRRVYSPTEEVRGKIRVSINEYYASKNRSS